MNIIEALKANNSPLRLDAGGRWLVWDEVVLMWVVYEEVYRQRESKKVYVGQSEEDAVAALEWEK